MPVLTVWQENANLWRYNLSEQTKPRNTRLAFVKVIVAGHMVAMRRAAEICAGGYQPGCLERGLLEQFADGRTGPADREPNPPPQAADRRKLMTAPLLTAARPPGGLTP